MQDTEKRFENPIAKFIPSYNATPTTNREVFVIGPNGEVGTGYYATWNGKSEWRVSPSNMVFFEPAYWADIPDTSDKATGHVPGVSNLGKVAEPA